MVGHSFSKLYATILHHWLLAELEGQHLRARGQAGFCPSYRMIDDIFTSSHYQGGSSLLFESLLLLCRLSKSV